MKENELKTKIGAGDIVEMIGNLSKDLLRMKNPRLGKVIAVNGAHVLVWPEGKTYPIDFLENEVKFYKKAIPTLPVEIKTAKTIDQIIEPFKKYISTSDVPDYLRRVVTIEDCKKIAKAYHAQYTPLSDKTVGLNLDKLEKEVDNFISGSTKESYEEAFKEIDKTVGVDRLIELINYDISWAKSEIAALPKVNDGTQRAYFEGFILGSGKTKQRVKSGLSQKEGELREENERLRGGLQKTLGLLFNIRHETDYMPDSYYEWIDKVINETDGLIPPDEEKPSDDKINEDDYNF